MIVTCEHLAQQLSDLEDGRLSPLEQKEAAFHLSWCKECQAYVAQFRAARLQLQQLKAAPLPPSSLQRALAAFHDNNSDDDDEDGSA